MYLSPRGGVTGGYTAVPDFMTWAKNVYVLTRGVVADGYTTVTDS